MRHALAAISIVLLSAYANAQTTQPAVAVVAADGSEKFSSVQDAINASSQTMTREHPYVIHIKPGKYRELVYVQREKRFTKLIGEDPKSTIITFDLNARMIGADRKIISTFRTPTAWIDADDFTVENITFENTAGNVGQALAIRIDGDRDVFRNCRFTGWQDTILGVRGRHYFSNCYISGAVDFIFGGATQFYDRCEIHCLGDGYITAASTPIEQPFGFVFSNCTIAGESNVKTYLGRPWRPFAATLFLNTKMSDVIRLEGWNNWKQPDREKTARYGEGQTSGVDVSHRVPWARQLGEQESAQITIEKVLAGADGWNPIAN